MTDAPSEDQAKLWPIREPRRNRDAVERTIRALRAAGRLDGIDSAVIAAARSTARALDAAGSPYVAATVARVHLEAVRQLTANAPAAADELGTVLSLLRSPVGNASES